MNTVLIQALKAASSEAYQAAATATSNAQCVYLRALADSLKAQAHSIERAA